MLMASNVRIRRRVRQLGLAQPPLDRLRPGRCCRRSPAVRFARTTPMLRLLTDSPRTSPGPLPSAEASAGFAPSPARRLVSLARREAVARRRPPIACASPDMSKPTTCRWPPRWEAASSSSRSPRRPRHRRPSHRPARHAGCRADPRSPSRRARPGRRAAAPAACRLAAGGHPPGRCAGHGRRGRHPRRRGRTANAQADLDRYEALLAANAGSRKARDDAQARRDVARDRVAALVSARVRPREGAAR